MQTYNLPTLPVKDMVAYFNELEISITSSDILKPSAPAVYRFYNDILLLYTGEHFVNDDSEAVFKCIRGMSNLLKRMGITFTARDLLPDSRRFVTILSYLVNFSMFRDSKAHIYNSASELADRNNLVKNKYKRVRDELLKEIEKSSKMSAENREKFGSLSKEIADISSELKSLYQVQKAKVEELTVLKRERNNLNDKLCSCEMMEHSLKEDITMLRTRIVDNPEELVELVEEMKQMIHGDRISTAKKNEEKLKIMAQLSSVKTGNLMLDRIHSKVSELSETSTLLENAEQQRDILESQLKNKESLINSLKIRINHANRQIEHLENKILNLTQADQRNSEALQKKISTIQRNHDLEVQERNLMESKIKQNNKEIQEMQFKMTNIRSAHDALCSEYINILLKIKTAIEINY